MQSPAELLLHTSSKRKDEEWWEWSVWIDGAPDELQRVEAVTYFLHPTFVKPVVRVTDAATRFRLDSEAWGEFSIEAELQFRDGHVLRLERWLELAEGPDGERAPAKEAPPMRVFLSYSLTDATVARRLKTLLQERNLTVTLPEDAARPGSDISVSIRDSAKRANAFIGLVSGTERGWMREEIGQAVRSKLPVFAVTLDAGSPTEVPGSTVQLIQRGERNLEQIADLLASRVRNALTPDTL